MLNNRFGADYVHVMSRAARECSLTEQQGKLPSQQNRLLEIIAHQHHVIATDHSRRNGKCQDLGGRLTLSGGARSARCVEAGWRPGGKA